MAKKSCASPEGQVSCLKEDGSEGNNLRGSTSTSPTIALRRASSYRAVRRVKMESTDADTAEKKPARRRNLRSKSTPNIPPHLFSPPLRPDNQGMTKTIDPLEERKKSLGALLGFNSLDQLLSSKGNTTRQKAFIKRSLSNVDGVREPVSTDEACRDVRKAASFTAPTKESNSRITSPSSSSRVSVEEMMNSLEGPLFQATTIFIPGYDFNKNRREELKPPQIPKEEADVKTMSRERRGSLPRGFKWRSKTVELKQEERRKDSLDLRGSNPSPSTRVLRKTSPAPSLTRGEERDAAKTESNALDKKAVDPSESSELIAPTQGRVRAAVANILGLNVEKYEINPSPPNQTKRERSERSRRRKLRHVTAPTITFTPDESCRSHQTEYDEIPITEEGASRLTARACVGSQVLLVKNRSDMIANLSKSIQNASISIRSHRPVIASTDLCLTEL